MDMSANIRAGRSLLALSLGLIASGCTTPEQQDRTTEMRFRSFAGMTMAQFSAKTLVTPSDFYNAGGGRVFLAYKSAPDPRYGCKMLIKTKQIGQAGNADTWVIESVTRQGGCDGV